MGPEAIAALMPAGQAAVQSDIGKAFRAVFGTIVAFTGIGAFLAFSSRCERTKERPAQ
jgi:hypothetical protein